MKGCWSCKKPRTPTSKCRRGLCRKCLLSLAARGAIHWRGDQLAERAYVHGSPGVVFLSAGELPPTKAKWIFPTTPRVWAKQGKSWVPVGPDYLNTLPTANRPQKFALAGLAVSGQHVFVSAKGPRNAFKALLGRGFSPPTFRPEPGLLKRMKPLLLPLIVGLLEPIEYDLEAWVSHLPGEKKRRARLAKQNIDRLGWSNDWSHFSAFVKVEKLNGTKNHRYITEILDRLIQAPTPEGLVIAAPYLWKMTKRLKDVWNIDSPIFYASVSPDQLTHWFNRHYVPGMIAICADYAKFDNSHSIETWEFLESLYSEAIVDELFFRLLAEWRAPRGKMTGRGWAFKYEAFVMNASGRPDTALANAILNGLVMFTVLCAIYFDISAEELTPAHVAEFFSVVHMAVVGDDSLVLLPDLPCFRNKQAISDGIGRFGFDASGDKMVISTRPFDMVFLGMRPYPVGGCWYFSKTIGRYVYKAGFVLEPQKYDLGAWIAGCAVADGRILRCVPALHEIIERTLALRTADGRSMKVTQMVEHTPWKSPADTPPYDMGTIRYLADGYDVPVEMILQSISTFKALPNLPFVTDDPFLRRCCEVDDL